MPRKDIFKEPFDEGTQIKLEVFSKYIQEWLPVFFTSNTIYWKTINIFDFFSGEGMDCNGTPGSPLLLLRNLKYYEDILVQKGLRVNLILNEYNSSKFNVLKRCIEGEDTINGVNLLLENNDFSDSFNRHHPSMKGGANLIFLDQNGIKQITPTVFGALISLKHTDFLFFTSSSYVKRFGDVPGFSEYIQIPRTKLESSNYFHIHREVLNYYKSLIPENRKYYLAPFSIKKGTNIYGLIFGTHHSFGIEKFLKVCWNIDPQRGEANFDIDSENINPETPSLFPEFNIPKKVQVFEADMEKLILNGRLATNEQLYLFALENGFLPKRANSVLKKLKDQKKIDFDFKMVGGKVHKIVKAPIKIM